MQREEGCIDVRPKILYSAQRVSYELGQGGKGPKATLVELISGEGWIPVGKLPSIKKGRAE